MHGGDILNSWSCYVLYCHMLEEFTVVWGGWGEIALQFHHGSMDVYYLLNSLLYLSWIYFCLTVNCWI